MQALIWLNKNTSLSRPMTKVFYQTNQYEPSMPVNMFNAMKSLKNYETYLKYGVYFGVLGLLIQALGFLFEKWTLMKLGYIFLLVEFVLLVIPLYFLYQKTKARSFLPSFKKE